MKNRRVRSTSFEISGNLRIIAWSLFPRSQKCQAELMCGLLFSSAFALTALHYSSFLQ